MPSSFVAISMGLPFSVTVSTDVHRENLLKRGERESLYELGRINVEADMTAEELLEQIE